jgi:hypothetical protein
MLIAIGDALGLAPDVGFGTVSIKELGMLTKYAWEEVTQRWSGERGN